MVTVASLVALHEPCPNLALDLLKTAGPFWKPHPPASAGNFLYSQGYELIPTPDGFLINDDCAI